MIALKVERLSSLLEHDSALRVLRRLIRGSFIRLEMRGQASEIFLQKGQRLRRLHVSGNSDHHIRGHIVSVEEFLRVGGGERIQIRHPAHGGPMIGMRLKSGCVELLQQASDRIAVGTQAPLLDHNIAFLIKLAHHGMQKALGLEIRPELEPVLGQ